LDLFSIRLIDYRTFGITKTAGSTEPRVNITGSLIYLHLELAWLSVHADQIRVGDHLYVQMPADLDQFRGDDSHGTVIGGKGLVQLRHDTTYGGGLFHYIDIVSGIG
jgi:hypothetical protein